MPAPRRIAQIRADIKGKRSPERPMSRDSNASTSSGRSSVATAVKKESAVLTDGSLAILAREIGAEQNNCLIFPMYLNTPMTAIVNATNCISDMGLVGANEKAKIDLTTKLLLEWKTKKAPTVKEKEKVKQLERALREMGKTDWADMLMEKHTNHTELTADAFAQ